jgi:hypothetical protein
MIIIPQKNDTIYEENIRRTPPLTSFGCQTILAGAFGALSVEGVDQELLQSETDSNTDRRNRLAQLDIVGAGGFPLEPGHQPGQHGQDHFLWIRNG